MGSTFLGSVPLIVGLRRYYVSQLQHRDSLLSLLSAKCSWSQEQSKVRELMQVLRPEPQRTCGRCSPSKSHTHYRRLDRSVLSKETKSCYIALHITGLVVRGTGKQLHVPITAGFPWYLTFANPFPRNQRQRTDGDNKTQSFYNISYP